MIMTESKPEQWVPMTEAAKEIGVNNAKLSRMASRGQIATKRNPYDFRQKLVNMTQLRDIFPPREQKGETL